MSSSKDDENNKNDERNEAGKLKGKGKDTEEEDTSEDEKIPGMSKPGEATRANEKPSEKIKVDENLYRNIEENIRVPSIKQEKIKEQEDDVDQDEFTEDHEKPSVSQTVDKRDKENEEPDEKIEDENLIDKITDELKDMMTGEDVEDEEESDEKKGDDDDNIIDHLKGKIKGMMSSEKLEHGEGHNQKDEENEDSGKKDDDNIIHHIKDKMKGMMSSEKAEDSEEEGAKKEKVKEKGIAIREKAAVTGKSGEGEEDDTIIGQIKDKIKGMMTSEKVEDSDEAGGKKEDDKDKGITKREKAADNGKRDEQKEDDTIIGQIKEKIKGMVTSEKAEDAEKLESMKEDVKAGDKKKDTEDSKKADDKLGDKIKGKIKDSLKREKTDEKLDEKKDTLGDQMKEKVKGIVKRDKADDNQDDDTVGKKIKGKIRDVIKREKSDEKNIKKDAKKDGEQGDDKIEKDNTGGDDGDDKEDDDKEGDKDKGKKGKKKKKQKDSTRSIKNIFKSILEPVETNTSFVHTIPGMIGKKMAVVRFKERSKPPESDLYDYRANRSYLVRANSLWETIVHMLMCGLSGGIVSLHEAYKDCGVWTALAINLVMAALVPYCVCILVWSAQKLYGRVQQATLTYPDVAEAALAISSCSCLRNCARAFRYIVEGTLIFHGFGSCSVFQVMIARNLKQLVDGECVSETNYPPLSTYILILMLPCMIVCMVTDLKNVAPFALIANTYTFGLTITEVVFLCKRQTDDILKVPAYKNIDGVFTFIGVCIFTLGSAHVALPLENNMNEPKKFHYVLLGTVPPVTICMTLMGVVGYWVHGELATSPITVHLPFEPFPVTVQVFLCLMLYVIFAVTFYIAFDVEWFYLKRNHHPSNHWFWERLYRTLHIIVVTFIAYGLPDPTRIMGVIGCVASPAIFIYPLIIELVLDWEYPGLGPYRWKIMKPIGLILVGLVILFAGSYFIISNIIQGGEIVFDFDKMNHLLAMNSTK